MLMMLEKLPFNLTICKVLSPNDLDLGNDFFFIGKTDEEISLVCKTQNTPPGAVERSDGWRGFRVQGTLDFSLTGVLSGLSGVLANSGIGIIAVSTYNTDYILVKERDFDRALNALADAGYPAQ